MVLLLMGLGFASGEPCEDFHVLVENALDSLWVGDVSSMEDGLHRAEQRLQCPDSMSQETMGTDLGHFYLLQAYSSHLNEHVDERSWWLQQSVNLGYWDPNFGPEMEDLLSEIVVSNSVVLSTIPERLPSMVEVRIDGAVHEPPLEVPQGLHWIEVYQEGALIHTEYIESKSGVFIRLPFETDVAWTPPVEQNRRRSALLGSGVLFATVGLSSHMMAMLNQRRYPQSQSLDELDRLHTQTWRWGQSSLVGFSLAGLCATVWTWNRLNEQTQLESADNDQVE